MARTPPERSTSQRMFDKRASSMDEDQLDQLLNANPLPTLYVSNVKEKEYVEPLRGLLPDALLDSKRFSFEYKFTIDQSTIPESFEAEGELDQMSFSVKSSGTNRTMFKQLILHKCHSMVCWYPKKEDSAMIFIHNMLGFGKDQQETWRKNTIATLESLDIHTRIADRACELFLRRVEKYIHATISAGAQNAKTAKAIWQDKAKKQVHHADWFKGISNARRAIRGGKVLIPENVSVTSGDGEHVLSDLMNILPKSDHAFKIKVLERVTKACLEFEHVDPPFDVVLERERKERANIHKAKLNRKKRGLSLTPPITHDEIWADEEDPERLYQQSVMEKNSQESVKIVTYLANLAQDMGGIPDTGGQFHDAAFGGESPRSPRTSLSDPFEHENPTDNYVPEEDFSSHQTPPPSKTLALNTLISGSRNKRGLPVDVIENGSNHGHLEKRRRIEEPRTVISRKITEREQEDEDDEYDDQQYSEDRLSPPVTGRITRNLDRMPGPSRDTSSFYNFSEPSLRSSQDQYQHEDVNELVGRGSDTAQIEPDAQLNTRRNKKKRTDQQQGGRRQ